MADQHFVLPLFNMYGQALSVWEREAGDPAGWVQALGEGVSSVVAIPRFASA